MFAPGFRPAALQFSCEVGSFALGATRGWIWCGALISIPILLLAFGKAQNPFADYVVLNLVSPGRDRSPSRRQHPV